MAKCARMVCQNEGTQPHRHLPGLYCMGCARLINRANGVEVVSIVGGAPGDGSMTFEEFKREMLLSADEAAHILGGHADVPAFKAAIEALPNRSKLDALANATLRDAVLAQLANFNLMGQLSPDSELLS